MDETVVKTIRNIEEFGNKAYEERIHNRTRGKRPPIGKKSLKNDVRILSKLFLATQMRDGDLDALFSYKSSVIPPALAYDGKSWSGVKADLLPLLKAFATAERNTNEGHLAHPQGNNDSVSTQQMMHESV